MKQVRMSGIVGGTATAAIAIALAGCGTSSTASPTAAEATGSPAASAPEAAGPGTPGAPGPGTPSSGAPSTGATGGGPETATGGGAGPGTGTPSRTGTETGERPGGGLGGDGAGARQPCATGTLSARLANRYAVETNRYVTLILTNTSRTACTVRGWSALQLINGGGVLPTRVVRHGTPQTVTIPGGGYAWERLYWSSELADDESVPCQPTPTMLRVTPPDQTRRLVTFWNQGPVCRHGTISLTPLKESPAPVAG